MNRAWSGWQEIRTYVIWNQTGEGFLQYPMTSFCRFLDANTTFDNEELHNQVTHFQKLSKKQANLEETRAGNPMSSKEFFLQ